MARRLDHSLSKTTRSKYPWHEWTDGSSWEITNPEDYTIGDLSMRNSLYNKAATLDCRVITDIRIPGVIRFQFIPRGQ